MPKAEKIVGPCKICGEEKELVFSKSGLCHTCGTVQIHGRGSWGSIADVLDVYREGTEQYVDENGKTKTHHLPRHIVEERVYQYALGVLGKKAHFFVDAYPYVFLREEGLIFKLHNDYDAATLLGKMRLRVTQPDFRLVRENLAVHVQGCGTEGRVEKLGTSRNGVIYVNNGRGGMFRIEGNKIATMPNGADGVLMLYPNLLPWPELNDENLEKMRAIVRRLRGIGAKVTPDSPLCRHLNAKFEDGNLRPQQYQQLVLLRWLSLFVGEALKLRPAMLATGEQNSGKSTLWEKFMWLLEGSEYKSGALPSKERSFVAAITNNAIQIFDNIDSVNFTNPRSDYPGYIDLMCKCSTGGKIPIAQLYETNVEKTYDLRCDLFFTARVNPFPSDRSDLARRTLPFPFRNLEPHEFITVEDMQRDLMADREEILLETLIRLQNILRGMESNKDRKYAPDTQMHSYEEWTMRIADHEGWAEEMKAIWQGYMGDYQKRITEDSPLVEFVRRWIGSKDGNVGRWVRVGQMYSDLYEIYHQDFTKIWRSDAGFGRAIKANLTPLHVLGIEKRTLDGYPMIRFVPSEAEVRQCRHSFSDSAPRQHRGDPEGLLEAEEAIEVG